MNAPHYLTHQSMISSSWKELFFATSWNTQLLTIIHNRFLMAITTRCPPFSTGAQSFSNLTWSGRRIEWEVINYQLLSNPNPMRQWTESWLLKELFSLYLSLSLSLSLSAEWPPKGTVKLLYPKIPVTSIS